jgi:hypothetical protein
MIRVGIVAEGTSDCLALEELMRVFHPEIEFLRLRPDMTLVSGSPHGWRGVKAWCQQEGGRLEAILAGVPGLPIHLLVIHVDCSMAHNIGASRSCPPARATADAMREVIVRDWLGRDSLPEFVVLVTPSWTTDTWVVATLNPAYSGKVPLECDDRAEMELTRRRLLRLKEGEIKKPEARYRPLVETMLQRLAHVFTICTEADRFRMEFTAASSSAADHTP